MEERFITSQHDQKSNSSGEGGGDELRSLFDQALQVFLSCRNICFSDTPALLGEGEPVDLFKLFWVVWGLGGSESVSEYELWELVGKECGVKNEVVTSLKLIYSKYLKGLDQWAEKKVRDMFLENGEVEVRGSLRLLVLELKKEPRGSLIGKLGGKKLKDGGCELKRTEKGQCNGSNVDDQKPSSSKRKRASLSLPGMLDWVREVAKNPRDLAIGKLPISKWKKCSADEFWVQVLMVREARLVKSPDGGSILEECAEEEENLPKKQKTQPSEIEDNNVVPLRRSQRRVRFSEKVSSSTKTHHPCSTSAPANKVAHCLKEAKKRKRNEEDVSHTEKKPKKRNFDITDEKSREKKVRMGPAVQADVPEWTGAVTDSDPKWLGTRVWPPPDQDTKVWPLPQDEEQQQACGEGRKVSCECNFPGSVSCVRFHIAEKRMKLKCDIGTPLFREWRFHLMGEEVAVSWTKEEERGFIDMMKTKTPSQFKSDSGCDFKTGQQWTRAQLIRYYFNVYTVRRLSFQSRMIPKEVDSDDEGKGLGWIDDSYGECVENREYIEW